MCFPLNVPFHGECACVAHPRVTGSHWNESTNTVRRRRKPFQIEAGFFLSLLM